MIYNVVMLLLGIVGTVITVLFLVDGFRFIEAQYRMYEKHGIGYPMNPFRMLELKKEINKLLLSFLRVGIFIFFVFMVNYFMF